MSEQPVVVVGGGLMGAATAWALARRGRPVLVLEQFAPDHAEGSSHGSARIVRRAYGDLLYTRLTGQAFELWRELEQATGTPVLRMLGGIDVGRAAQVAGHLADAGVPHEIVPAAEAESRWPGMRFAEDVVFHPQAGTVDSAAAVRSMLEQAALAGAQVRYGATVTQVAPDAVITADGERIGAAAVAVTAGAWAGPLLDGLVDLPPLRVTQEQIAHFPRLDPSADPWPSVIDPAPTGHVYHLAGGRDGGPGDDRKIGVHDAGVETTAAGRDHVLREHARRHVIDYVRRWLPGLDPTPRNETTCLYTRTPSEDFVVDRAPGGLVVCSACSGHGAKFAPLIGEFVADAVTGTTGVAGALPDRFRLSWHARAGSATVSL